MSEAVDGFRALADYRREMRAAIGVPCPECKRKRPRAHATILVPEQRCRIDGYRDPRPESVTEAWHDRYTRELARAREGPRD